jgi:hypothetical protein
MPGAGLGSCVSGDAMSAMPSGAMSILVWKITASATGLPVALFISRTATVTSSPFLISVLTGSNA